LTDEPARAAVEDGDLDVILSMALVLKGRYRDLIAIRAKVREMIAACGETARFIHGPVSSVPLYIVKGEDWKRLKNLETLENPTGGEKQK
jgi:hypothetical protein